MNPPQPSWELMFSFAGSLREEVRKVAEYICAGSLEKNNIFFDDWTIPRCAHLMSACEVGIARSKRVVFIITQEFVLKSRRLSTLLEWAMCLKEKDPRSILIVLYQKSTDTVNIFDELKKKLRTMDPKVFGFAEKCLWYDTPKDQNNHTEFPSKLLELTCSMNRCQISVPPGVKLWPKWGWRGHGSPLLIVYHHYRKIESTHQVYVEGKKYGCNDCAVPPPPPLPLPFCSPNVASVDSHVHVVAVTTSPDSLTHLNGIIKERFLNRENPPFVIYMEKPIDIAKAWVKSFGEPFWLRDYLGYHWKGKEDDAARCFGKIAEAGDVLELPFK